jgi:hypothetical protein
MSNELLLLVGKGKFRITEPEVSDDNNYQQRLPCGGNSAVAIMRGPVCSFTRWMR